MLYINLINDKLKKSYNKQNILTFQGWVNPQTYYDGHETFYGNIPSSLMNFQSMIMILE